MRIFVSVVVLVLLPTAGFFLWAWMIAMARQRRLAGTLPRWQDLPWTWLLIAGLALALAGLLYMVLLTDRPEGGWFGPPHGAAQPPPRSVLAILETKGHTLAHARIAPVALAAAAAGVNTPGSGPHHACPGQFYRAAIGASAHSGRA
jgi:hypothetical protein